MTPHRSITAAAAAGLLAATIASAASHTTHHGGTSTHAFVGRHQMTGTVTSVDRTAGKIQVEAEGEKLDLHFPRSALTNIQPGDQVAVELAIREVTPGRSGSQTHTPGSAGGTSPRGAGDNPDNTGEMGENSGGLTQ